MRVVLAVGIVIHIVGFLLFQLKAPQPVEYGTAGSFLEYVSSDTLIQGGALEERSLLFDSAPLFIPTRWNASQALSFAPNNSARGRFPDYLPDIDLTSNLKPSNLPALERYPVSEPNDLLATRFWRLFDGFGQSGDPVIPFADVVCRAVVSLIDASSQGLPHVSPLVLPMQIEYTPTGNVPPDPVVFYLRTARASVVSSRPVLAQSSGDQAFDQAVKESLERAEMLAAFPIGYLAVRVFPGISP